MLIKWAFLVGSFAYSTHWPSHVVLRVKLNDSVKP